MTQSLAIYLIPARRAGKAPCDETACGLSAVFTADQYPRTPETGDTRHLCRGCAASLAAKFVEETAL